MAKRSRFSLYAKDTLNIRATHHKTIEFTREDDLSPRGTCVLGVRADALLQTPQTRLEVTLETLAQDDTPPPL